MTLQRRQLLAVPLALGLGLGLRQARAGSAIGTTLGLTGRGRISRAGIESALHPKDPLMEGDDIRTLAASTAALELFRATEIHLGPETRFTLDRFSADLGGIVTIGGAMVFDRPDDLPKLDLTVQSAFGQIGVRGTRFFAGPSKGVYGVFVARGTVEVSAGGQRRSLQAGEGVDIAAPGDAPGAVARWGRTRIDAAFASVGLRP